MPIAIKTGAITGLALMLLAGGAMAQTSSPGAAPGTAAPGSAAPGNTAPGSATPRAADTQVDAAPVAGANSFTERQAQARITDAGYSQVTNMTLGQDGVWRGRAMRDGVAQDVALDYRGEIFAGERARATATGTRSDNAAAPGTSPTR